MKNRNMIFDFTQCYPKRKEPGLEWHDCSAIGGSRLYCSRDAEEKIKALIAPAGVSGIHFIDSGDYHYISKIMTDFIKELITLVLIDFITAAFQFFQSVSCHTDNVGQLIHGFFGLV